MSSDRTAARVAGVLFIIATAASLLSTPFLSSASDANYLTAISANANQYDFGVFLSLIAAVSSASIAVSMYPVLKRHSESLALGAVGFRFVEGAFYIVAAMGLLSLQSLSQGFASAGTVAAPEYQVLGTSLLASYHWAGNVASLTAFSLGAMMYYFVFYRARLVPRWLSVWGLVAAAMTLLAGVLVMFGAIGPFSTGQIILALPIAVQEMVLAVWLIVKGFKILPLSTLS